MPHTYWLRHHGFLNYWDPIGRQAAYRSPRLADLDAQRELESIYPQQSVGLQSLIILRILFYFQLRTPRCQIRFIPLAPLQCFRSRARASVRKLKSTNIPTPSVDSVGVSVLYGQQQTCH